MKKKTGVLTIIASLLVVALLLASCGGGGGNSGSGGGEETQQAETSQESSSSSSGESSSAKEESKTEESAPAAESAEEAPPVIEEDGNGYTLPISDGSYTMRILSPECYAPGKSFSEILPIYQKYVEEAGVNLDWEAISGADYDATVSVRLAASSDLPDIVRLPGGIGSWNNYIDGGIFVQLDPLLKYAPNITRMFYDYRPDIRKAITYADGNLWILPTQVMGIEAGKSANDFANPPAWDIRIDILDRLGLQIPTTVDEFYDVLVAVKEDDPNIKPLNGGSWVDYANHMMWSWGLNGWDGVIMENGTVIDCWTHPDMLEVLTVLNKWYNEGLLDPEPGGAWAEKGVNGTIFSHFGNTGYCFVYDAELKQNIPGAEWTIMEVPKANAGSKPFVVGYGFWNNSWGLTTGSKDPEIAIKMMDHMFYTDRAFIDQMYGVEGVDWVFGPDGNPTATDYFKEQAALDGNYIYSTGAYADTNMPQCYIMEYRLESYKTFLGGLTWGQHAMDTAFKLGNSLSERFPQMMVLPVESEEINLYMPDITTYREETIAKFIRGEEPLSNFDKYVETIYSYGLEKVLAIKQQQYDRYQGK